MPLNFKLKSNLSQKEKDIIASLTSNLATLSKSTAESKAPLSATSFLILILVKTWILLNLIASLLSKPLTFSRILLKSSSLATKAFTSTFAKNFSTSLQTTEPQNHLKPSQPNSANASTSTPSMIQSIKPIGSLEFPTPNTKKQNSLKSKSTGEGWKV